MPPWHFSSIQASLQEEEGVNGEMGLEKYSQMLNCSRRIIQNHNLTATRQSSSPLLTILTTLVNSCDPQMCFILKKEESFCICQGHEGTTRPAGHAQLPLGSPPAPAHGQVPISALPGTVSPCPRGRSANPQPSFQPCLLLGLKPALQAASWTDLTNMLQLVSGPVSVSVLGGLWSPAATFSPDSSLAPFLLLLPVSHGWTLELFLCVLCLGLSMVPVLLAKCEMVLHG